MCKIGDKDKNMDFTDDFAEKYWEEFEKLTMTLLEECFSKNGNFIYNSEKTEKTKDGGYDGIIFVESDAKKIYNLKDVYIILVEAKLRKNANRDLPLSDFAKTLIIAINKYANKVIIFTNLHFSDETKNRIKKFENATSLEVSLVDIFEICHMISTHDSIKSDFTPTFISELLDAKTLHNVKKKTCCNKELLGRNPLPKLVGTKRKLLLDKYSENLKNKNGVAIITGAQGCGKSLFLKHIMHQWNFFSNNIIIELQKFSTAKEFFIQILSIIWSVDPLDIYALTLKDINEITSYMSEDSFSEKMKNVLLNILTDEMTIYEGRKDTFESHLIEYLFKIFVPILNRKKYVIAFTNFEKAEKNIINFTDKFIKKFYSENILFILEIRNDVPSLEEYREKWGELYTDIEQIEITEFNYIEFVKYMEEAHSDVSRELVNKLFDVCIPNPLYIESILPFVSENPYILYDNELNLKKLYENPKFSEKHLNSFIVLFLKKQNFNVKKVAAILGFFEGELKISNIKEIDEKMDETISVLVDSKYFDQEFDTLKIHHVAYLQQLKERKYLSKSELNKTLKLLFDKISKFSIDKKTKEIKKLHIAILLSSNSYIVENWEMVCTYLINQEEYRLAQSLLEQIYNQNSCFISSQLRFLTKLIQCYIGLNQYNSENFKEYIKSGDQVIKITENEDDKMAYLYVKAKYYMVQGDYKKVIDITNYYCNSDYNLRYIRALGVKHLYGINECLKSLKRGISHFPDDWHLKYSYLDHKHSKFEKIDYEKAWNYLVEIEEYWEKLTLEDQIHYKYNKLAISFYQDKLTELDECRKLISETFQNNLPVEEGRIHNLMGQYYWLKNDLTNAIKEFKNALELFNETVHGTYIYIPPANLALLYDASKCQENALDYGKQAIDILIELKEDKIKSQLETLGNLDVIEKEIATFLLMLDIIKREDKKQYENYIKQFKLNSIEEKLELLHSTYYFHKGKFMIRS